MLCEFLTQTGSKHAITVNCILIDVYASYDDTKKNIETDQFSKNIIIGPFKTWEDDPPNVLLYMMQLAFMINLWRHFTSVSDVMSRTTTSNAAHHAQTPNMMNKHI